MTRYNERRPSDQNIFRSPSNPTQWTLTFRIRLATIPGGATILNIFTATGVPVESVWSEVAAATVA